jgi:hypothetical protein
MNPIEFQNELTPEERELALHLVKTAESLQPAGPFLNKTEAQLRDAFLAKKEIPMKRIQLLWQTLAGAAAVILLALAINWLVRSVAPVVQPTPVPAENVFLCPITQPNGSAPPGEAPSDMYLGNDLLWTVLWPDGKIIMTEAHNRKPDGSLSMKWGWWRGLTGPLSIEGRRLDAEATPLRADIPDGYGETGFQVSALIFPTTGCWEVTGRVGEASLTFVTEVVMAGDPTPIPILAPTSTPRPDLQVYERFGTTIYRAAEFPDAPAEMGIYTHTADGPVTIETAQMLAARFGVVGEVYRNTTTTESPTPYIISDGKQRLVVSSSGRFTYYRDYSAASTEAPVNLAVAKFAIAKFLPQVGFDFDYQVEPGIGMGAGWFWVRPKILEGHVIRFDVGLAQGFSVKIDADGNVSVLDANLLNVDAQSVGSFGIISAREAWEMYLQSGLGVKESFRSSPGGERFYWTRVYPDEQPTAIYGNLTIDQAVENGKPPLMMIDSHAISGNTAGLEALEPYSLVKAQGQFITRDGVRIFRVDTWETVSQTSFAYLEGSLGQDGEQVRFHSTVDGAQYLVRDLPAALSIPAEEIIINGVLDGQELVWTSIAYYPKGVSNMGGGGGGGNFAKLNLSGVPVVWPTPEPPIQVTPESLIGQRLDGVQGTLLVNIYRKPDGSQRTEYTFSVSDSYYALAGANLNSLDAYHNRPLTIWGIVTGYQTQYPIPIVTVEQFEIPFPDLEFQVLTGAQKLVTVDGQQATLFTSQDGQVYAQIMSNGAPDSAILGREGDTVFMEVLVVPDEMFGNYPAMRVFSGGMATSPKNGQPTELEVTANQPYVMEEPQDAQPVAIPTLTIETIELAYFTSDPAYAQSYPAAMTPYIQPVWRFYGHYSDGSEVEVLVQALKQEYLYPEPAPSVEPG